MEIEAGTLEPLGLVALAGVAVLALRKPDTTSVANACGYVTCRMGGKQGTLQDKGTAFTRGWPAAFLPSSAITASPRTAVPGRAC